jgi:hypothetical protein
MASLCRSLAISSLKPLSSMALNDAAAAAAFLAVRPENDK